MHRSSTTAAAPSSSSVNSKTALAPLDGSVRANSAQANLQTHPCFQSSLFNDKERAAGSLKAWKERQNLGKHYQSSSDGMSATGGVAGRSLNKDYQLENVIWSQSVKQARRLTLNNAENISDLEIMMLKRQKSYALAALGEMKGKIGLEEKLSLDALNELHVAFNEADMDGNGTLELDEFKDVVKNALKIQGRNDEEIAALFMKINFSSNGRISWEEFCTFMQLNFSEKEDSLRRQKEVIFNVPARSESNPHRQSIQKIACTGDNNYMVMSSDGIVTFWSPNGDLKRVKRDILEKRVVVKDKGDKQDTKRTKPKWNTDFMILTEFNKIVIGTGDRELQFWELSSFEPYCQVSSLPTVPIKLSYCYFDRDDVIICYGDTDGCVNILEFTAMGETLRTWKTQPLVAQMPNIHLDKALESPSVKLIRWKTHNDWIEQIRIDRRLNQIISCSNDEYNAVVIGCIKQSTDVNSHTAPNITHTTSNIEGMSTSTNMHQSSAGALGSTASISGSNAHHHSGSSILEVGKREKEKTMMSIANTNSNRIASPSVYAQQQQGGANLGISISSINVKRRPEVNETVFKINKGVKAFDFSFEKNLLITGGMDRIIRLYNPYVPSRPIAHLKSHITPIFFIHLCTDDSRIFTMSTDTCLNVWDLVDHSCLASLRPKSHKIKGELQACCYNSRSRTLLITTDKVSLLSLKLKANLHTEVVLSHKEPVVCCLYNKQFKQLVSCTENGTVKLWDVETGHDIFEFNNAHGDQAVTCMTFDDSGRRLITGGRDGTCRVWNFNNGHCLKILRKETKHEITDLKYTRIYNNKFIVTVGWDRRINIYDDDVSDARVFTDPNTPWVDDIKNGHKEDILCIAKSESNFLATSGYDGLIIIWNMVSGHIFSELRSPKPDNYRDENLDGDLSVNKLIFLNRERLNNKTSAHLISSGPWGMIHFWTIFSGTAIHARFRVNDKKGTSVTRMCVDARCTRLFASDNHGYVYYWNIDGYALEGKENHPPELVKCWRAHVQNITAIEFIDSAKVLITGSSDCTIRVWTPDGKYIGTFGQDEVWNLYDEKSYKHPLVPYDILVDQQSLPEHPMLSKRETMLDVLEITKSSDKKEQEKFAKMMASNKSNLIDDDQIAEQIREMKVPPEKIGKRLRHETMKPMILPDKTSKNYYQMLNCHDCDLMPNDIQSLMTTAKTRSKTEHHFSSRVKP